MRIVHLTSVHRRYDPRIFLKECRSLARAGHDAILIVADGKGDEVKDGVEILDVGAPRGRLDRAYRTVEKILAKSIEVGGGIYQMHDPELLRVVPRLKRLGKKVVYDAHEDLPIQVLGKPYLSPWVRRVLSSACRQYETWAGRRVDGIVAATPYIRDKFAPINPRSVDICNFPMLEELSLDPIDWSGKLAQVCYIGGISRQRGLLEIMQALTLTRSNVRLQLGGSFYEPDVERQFDSYPGAAQVDRLGFLDRAAVRNVLNRSIAGLVTLHPLKSYVDSLPVKLFEYMAAGVPVIASNFPTWREIVEAGPCGLLVDPLQPQQIADAIDYLATHRDEAERMGRQGQTLVRERYNWSIEEKKLLEFYERLGARRPKSAAATHANGKSTPGDLSTP